MEAQGLGICGDEAQKECLQWESQPHMIHDMGKPLSAAPMLRPGPALGSGPQPSPSPHSRRWETTITGPTGGGGSSRDERQLREWFQLW